MYPVHLVFYYSLLFFFLYRLLYSNSSLKREESILVRLVSLQEPKKNRESIARKRDEEENADDDELNPASVSEMADSGLETGSLSPLENSESSVTDFEVSQGDRVSMDDVDLISVGLNGVVEDAPPLPSGLDPSSPRTSSTTKDYLDENSSKAGIVVSVTDEKLKKADSNAYHSRDNCFLLTKEFEFVDTRTSEPGREKSGSPPGCSNDRTFDSNEGNTSNYFFIDASSLNDNELQDERNEKPSNCPSVVQEKTIGNTRLAAPLVALSEKPVIEKEALIVEIKEADSGESGQPSPCSENMRRAENTAAAPTVTTLVESDSRRSSLIRRNTFELDPNDEKLSVLRQEYERRQGHLVFQNAIPQYSGHRVDGDSCFEPSSHHELAPDLLISSSTTSSLPIVPVAKYGVDPMSQTKSLVESINKVTNVVSYEKQQQVPNKDSTNYERRPSGCWLFAGDSNQASSKDGGISEIRGTFSRNSTEETTPSGPEDPCPISEFSSDKLFLESCSESDDGSRNCCNSLPITLNDQRQIARERRSSVNSRAQRERTKRDETTPILSGGVSTADYVRRNESPATKRRIESTPIISGGSVLAENETSLEDLAVAKPPVRMASSMTAAWVVDMSDCTKNSANVAAATGATNATSKLASNGQPIMSKSFSSSSDCVATANKNNVKRTRACETKHASLGFFVNLNDIETRDSREKTQHDPTNKGAAAGALETCGGKNSCEFFVDISRKEDNGRVGARGSGSSTNGEESGAGSRNSGESNNGKKNIFSMFIDFREPKRGSREHDDDDNVDDDDEQVISAGRPEEKPRDPKSLSKLTSGELSGGESSSSSQIDRIERVKPATSVFMFIESDSPIVRRRALSSSRPAAFQRHSWNVPDKPTSTTPTMSLKKDCSVRREHKRAHSVSVDRTDLRTLHTKASNSSHSLSQVARADTLNSSNGNLPKRNHDHESSGRNTDTSTEEVFEYDTRDTPPNSHVEIVGEQKEELGLGHVMVGKPNGLFKKNDEELEMEGKKQAQKTQQRNQQLDTDIGDAITKAYEDECGSEVSVWEKTGTESTTEGNTRKSETFDISSGASGVSPESDNNNHFHLDDIHDDIEMTNYKAASLRLNESSDVDSGDGGPRAAGDRLSETHKSLTETIKKIESELKKPEIEVDTATRDDKQQEASASSFVRLSDLDATPLSSSRLSDAVSRGREHETIYRMSNSIPETSWVESKLALNRNNNSSSRALPRKFTTIMSTSLPAKHKSPIEDATECEADAAIISESDLSSMQSSMGRSGAGKKIASCLFNLHFITFP